MRDISDLKRAELELKAINAELDWYAHSVSHDLKSPISSLCMAADALERLVEGTDRQDVREVALPFFSFIPAAPRGWSPSSWRRSAKRRSTSGRWVPSPGPSAPTK